MKLINTIKETKDIINQAKNENKTIGLVPTMGALHTGHISLIEKAKGMCDFIVVSDFVNPSQFAVGEDFDKYPRTIDEDFKKCEAAGANLLFAPSANEIYSKGYSSWIEVQGIASLLEGEFRPTHFKGVTTICGKLFNITSPKYAFFGQKDFQQVSVVKKMVIDLNMPLEIISCPIIRDTDGIALSSRNKYLSEETRIRALHISKAIFKAKIMAQEKNPVNKILKMTFEEIKEGFPEKIDYVSIVDCDTLLPTESTHNAVLLIAAYFGGVRLIDNTLL